MSRRTPSRRRMLTLTVLRSSRLSPNFLRLTIGGPQLADFEYQGWDQCVRVFFRRPGQTDLRMPTRSNNGWAAQFYLMPASSRPHVRNYTVRAFRPESLELDVDFVIHGDGAAPTWAASAAPGEPVGIFDEGTMYQPGPRARWQLLVADESGVPAALVIAEQTPTSLPTLLYLEVPTAQDILPVQLSENVNIEWLPRESQHTNPGRLVLDIASNVAVPAGSTSMFIAGESGLATGLRRHMIAVRGIPKSQVTFYGYWKRGRASPG